LTSSFEPRTSNLIFLLDKGDLVDFTKGGTPFHDLLQRGLSQEGHSFFFRRFLDLRGRPPIEDHPANPIGQIEKFRDRRAAVEAGAVALQAAFAFPERLAAEKLA